ncbi:MAG: hypothetical protein AAFO07_10205, partial [Bacteroidota bacterium]
REVVAEGKVAESVGSESFWKIRTSFFESFFDTETNEYQTLVIDEFDKLSQLNLYDEIILWFEYDLFCQLNMMALLSWFSNQQGIEAKLSLVCIGKVEGYDKMVGLGEVDPALYASFYENRTALVQEDLEFARSFWSVYSSHDPTPLIDMTSERGETFPYLANAIEAHLRRFPSVYNGLNKIEDRMLKIVHSGIQDRRRVVGQMLREDNDYGFGDMQYFIYLKNLYPLLEDDNNGLAVNESGNKVLDGEEDFMDHAKHEYYFGGAYFKDYRWDEENHKLIKFIPKNKD